MGAVVKLDPVQVCGWKLEEGAVARAASVGMPVVQDQTALVVGSNPDVVDPEHRARVEQVGPEGVGLFLPRPGGSPVVDPLELDRFETVVAQHLRHGRKSDVGLGDLQVGVGQTEPVCNRPAPRLRSASARRAG
jgi:hypothetical protein